jgi:DNA invertase Pin-like site-specific DNA recombinase
VTPTTWWPPPLDRISRSVSDVSGLMTRSVEEEWGLVCLRESIDTSTAMGRAFVQIAAVFAELERGLVSERTKAGMAQKKLEGSVFGKPSKLDPAVRARITRPVRRRRR